MNHFEHISPVDLEEAVETLSVGGSRAIAGGTDILGELKDEIGPDYPSILVDLKTVPNLDYIQLEGQSLHIGALTKLSGLASHPVVIEHFPSLAAAASSVASPQIQEMATVGGNVCQSTRCWYYWAPDNRFHCMRKGGDPCFALAGDNRYHSVFGGIRFQPAPCVRACPSSIDIPSYVPRLEVDTIEAARQLLLYNPMPAITGRVCPHFCEAECNRSELDGSVSIRAVERFVGDYVLDNWDRLGLSPGRDTGLRVAVIGAGPAGLSAAYFLRMDGHEVVVFDRLDRPGGMLNHAIPTYRLPENIVDRQINLFRSLGVTFRLGVELGRDISVRELREQFDSVFVATGAWDEKQLHVGEGPELLTGLEFLRHARTGARIAPSRRTLVIGGGNVAIDAAITAKRLQAEHVALACLEPLEQMPAIRSEVEAALEEGIEILPSCGPSRVVMAQGSLAGMELATCTSVFNSAGEFAPVLDHESCQTFEADRIIVAIGQAPQLSGLRADLPQSAFVRGLVGADPQTQETVVKGVYAGGDLTTGPSFVTTGIAAGRRAASAINRSLVGEETTPELATTRDYCRSSYAAGIPKCTQSSLAAEVRGLEAEDWGGITAKQAQVEAGRCMNCSCVSVSGSDLAAVLVALRARIKTTKRTIEAFDFFAVNVGTSTVLDFDEVVTEVEVPRPPDGSTSSFTKFALRKTIDFPVVSCAVVLQTVGGTIRSASICLNAVYGRPYVAADAERYLVGKPVTRDSAAAAAELATQAGAALSGNAYKLRIARVLVERGILACSP